MILYQACFVRGNPYQATLLSVWHSVFLIKMQNGFGATPYGTLITKPQATVCTPATGCKSNIQGGQEQRARGYKPSNRLLCDLAFRSYMPSTPRPCRRLRLQQQASSQLQGTGQQPLALCSTLPNLLQTQHASSTPSKSCTYLAGEHQSIAWQQTQLSKLCTQTCTSQTRLL